MLCPSQWNASHQLPGLPLQLSLVISKLAPALAQDSSVPGRHPDIQPTPLFELPTAFGLLLPMPVPLFAEPGAAALAQPPGLAQAAA